MHLRRIFFTKVHANSHLFSPLTNSLKSESLIYFPSSELHPQIQLEIQVLKQVCSYDKKIHRLRDHLISLHVISRHNYFRTVGGWFQVPFVLKIV